MELLEEILNPENLNKAYKKVYQNKGASGVDEITVEEVSKYLKENKDRILKQIRERRYKPQPVRRVRIPKENGKKRNLGIPTVMDRIIQQAMVQKLSPIFEEQFSNNSYGFRPNRSCEQAVIKALEYLNDGYEWIVDIDLEKFFDTVNQDRLITIIRKTIKDGEVVSLIRKYLSAGVMENGTVKPSLQGTPQGGNLSPLLSNRIKQINYLVRGWINYFRIANMKNEIAKIDEHLRTRIRVVIWKQWKIPKRRIKGLRQLGVKPELAKTISYSRKGYQLICKTDWLKFAINIERLRKRGLVFLLDQYQKVHIEI